MNRNEPDPTKRRVGLIPFVDASNNFVPGLTFQTSLGEVLVSIDGTTPVAAANDITETGRGFYWYQASQAETNCSHLIVILRKAGYIEQSFTQQTGPVPLMRNEINAEKRIITALPFYDNDGALLPGQTFLTASTEILISENGAAWTPASSDAFAVEGGLYGYVATQAETNVGSFFGVLLAKATYSDRVYTQLVGDGGGGGGGDIVVSNVSPAPYLPVLPQFAIQFDITSVAGLALVLPFIGLNPYLCPELVHDGVDFTGLYIQSSSRVVITNGYRYTIRRKGGWYAQPHLIIQAVNVNGVPWTGP